MSNMEINLSIKDQKLVQDVFDQISKAYETAENPIAVAKKIFSRASRYRNKGRDAAMRRHPFKDICEESGKLLQKMDAHFDECEPEKGYLGRVRWVCPKANNSGKKSCGEC